MIGELSLEELGLLYKQHIKADFTRMERRPIASIRALAKKGNYSCLVLREGEALQAYACFIKAEDVGGVLLDYFAVVPELRGSGVGGRFLAELRSRSTAEGIVIECEMPSHAAGEADRLTRQRRIAFYQRGGAELSDIGWHLYGVDYNLLWLPVRKTLAEVDLEAQAVGLYAHAMPPALRKLHLRTYRVSADGREQA